MNNEDFKIFIEDFVDFLNSLEASVVKMRAQIEKLEGVRLWNWNPDKIAWTKAQGEKGEYERSEDINSLDFKNLLKDLAEHKGSLIRDSWFYWTFKNGSVVGKKKRG
jgi:hypothetical protein